jgi:hypothetical protein
MVQRLRFNLAIATDALTYESVGLRREKIMVLHFEPASQYRNHSTWRNPRFLYLFSLLAHATEHG